MKKKSMIIAAAMLLGAAFTANAQVTIGSDELPHATLDVVGDADNAATAEGIIAPRLTGNELKAKDGVYGADQTGAMVYVIAPVTSASAKTANVTAAGYYYFDGTLWHSVSGVDNNTLYDISYESSTSLLTLTPTTGDGSPVAIPLPKDTASNGLTKNGNDVQLGGTLTKATAIAQGTNPLTFSGTGKTIVNSPLQYNNTAAAPGANKVLTSDASGNATWRDIARNYTEGNRPRTDTTWITRSGAGYTYTGMNVEIPTGKSILRVGQLIINRTNYSGYVTLRISTDSTTMSVNTGPNPPIPGIVYFPNLASFNNMSAKSYSTDQIEFDIENNSGQPVRIYIWEAVSGLGGIVGGLVPDRNIIDASNSFGIINTGLENFIVVYY